MSTIHFEPFAERFQRSAKAGLHDGTKSVVGLDHTPNPLIQRHEWVHGQIFTSTPDGQLLAALLSLYHNRIDVEPLGLSPDWYTELLTPIMNTSEAAHEAAATYLSVKMEVPEAQPGQLALLSSEYRRYYSIFGDVLDDGIGSSYLQYLVAWNAAVVCFSSRYLERFSADPNAASLRPGTNEQPDARLAAILDPLRAHFDRLLAVIDHHFRLACDRHQIAPWDPHDEGGWVALGQRAPEMVPRIEAELTLALRPFLIDLGGIPALLDDEHRRAYEALSGWLQRAGAEFSRMADYDWRAHDENAARAIDAHNQAAAGIEGKGKAIRREPGAAVADWSLVDSSSSFVFVEDESMADGPWTDRQAFAARFRAGDDDWLRRETAGRQWNAFAWRDRPYQGEPVEARSLDQGKLIEWLRARNQPGLRGTSPIALVTRPSDILHLMANHTLLYGELEVDRGSWEPGQTVLPLCHYLQGNWLTWFEELRSLREAFSPLGPWKLIVGNVQLRPPYTGSVVLHLLWHGVLGASFFRLTSPHATERMKPEITRLLKEADVEPMTDVSEARTFRSLYEGIILPRLFACWSSL